MRVAISKGILGSGSWLCTFYLANVELMKSAAVAMSVLVGLLTGISVGLDIWKKWRHRKD